MLRIKTTFAMMDDTGAPPDVIKIWEAMPTTTFMFDGASEEIIRHKMNLHWNAFLDAYFQRGFFAPKPPKIRKRKSHTQTKLFK